MVSWRAELRAAEREATLLMTEGREEGEGGRLYRWGYREEQEEGGTEGGGKGGSSQSWGRGFVREPFASDVMLSLWTGHDP